MDKNPDLKGVYIVKNGHFGPQRIVNEDRTVAVDSAVFLYLQTNLSGKDVVPAWRSMLSELVCGHDNSIRRSM